MKIRTDFVTNSSSSCFCAILTLQFDNDKNKTIKMSTSFGGGEVFDQPCTSNLYGGLSTYSIQDTNEAYMRIIESKDDKQKLLSALLAVLSVSRKQEAYFVLETEKMTKADLVIHACVYGEEDYNGEIFNMFKIRWIDDSDINLTEYLRKEGIFELYSDEALEQIVLSHKRRFQNENGESKTINARLNKNGKIDVTIVQEEGYHPVSHNVYNMLQKKYETSAKPSNKVIGEGIIKQLELELMKTHEEKSLIANKIRSH